MKLSLQLKYFTDVRRRSFYSEANFSETSLDIA